MQQFSEHAIVTVSATGAAGEQSFAIPGDATMLTFQVRGETSNLIYYFKSTANGGGLTDGKYFSLPAGNAKTFVNFRMQGGGQTIYFQVPSGQTVPATIEIEYCIG